MTPPRSNDLVSAARIAALLLIVASSAPLAAQVPGLQANSARDCAVCHLNWVDSFQRPQSAVLLMDTPGSLVVSESQTCLGCHDGSVGDSRRRVWSEHSHATGVAPLPGMTVPAQLPLLDGKLACRTCHTAHGSQGPETLATTVFLRMPNDNGQLCASCHADKTKGPELGTHPIGGMPWPVPDALLAAGAKRSPDPQRLTCQTCHTPHGSHEDHLLVMGTQSSQLCLTCHTKLRPGMWRPDTEREHPLTPKLDPTQHQAILDMGTRIGENDTLICLSCHKLHHGKAGRNMLADTLQESQLCIRCHPGRADMFNTQHDLRKTAPEERNRLGQTPTESGPCGACHTFHQFARRPDPQPLDPSGLCATCHQQDRCAGQKTGLPFSHPIADLQKAVQPGGLELTFYPSRDNPAVKTVACLTCHNPHETKHPHFLRADASTLCSTCHTELADGMGQTHDFTRLPELRNARNDTAAEAGKCGFCHGIHNAVGPKLWVATAQAPKNANDYCVQCHSETGLAKSVHMSPLRHPNGPDATMSALAPLPPAAVSAPATSLRTPGSAALPLFDATGHHSADGFIACATCHDPHGGANGVPDLLRQGPQANGAELCANCHTEARSIHTSLHNAELLQAAFPDQARFCAPCHAVHEAPGMPATGMWSAPPGPLGQNPATQICTGCHQPANVAAIAPPMIRLKPDEATTRPAATLVPTAITPTIHPPVPMSNVVGPDGPGYMPLYDNAGNPGPNGTIACGTCHLPHGPPSAAATPTTAPALSIDELRGLRPMVRPYTTPNVCSACHGFDGLRRYLYFHDPVRRRNLSDEARP